MNTSKTSKARENIFKKIRNALQDESIPMPYPEIEVKNYDDLFHIDRDTSKDEVFAKNFTQAGGKFIYCEHYQDFLTTLQQMIKQRNWKEVGCSNTSLLTYLINNNLSFVRELHHEDQTLDVCITDCELAIAQTGSFVFSSKQNFGRSSSIYHPVHIVLLTSNQIISTLSKGVNTLNTKYKNHLPSMVSFSTGPSRTADIEKTLVTGIHGPKEIFCIYINQPQ